MNSNNLMQFDKPVKVSNNESVYCPYYKADNIFKNISGVPTPQTLTGAPVDKICLPNLNYRKPPKGFGENICKNNTPYHITFFGGPNECYQDPNCTIKLKDCYDPLTDH